MIHGGVIANLSKKYPNIDDDKLNEFRDGVTALNFTDGKGSIIIDTKGNTVAKTDCDEIQLFHEGLAVCKKDGTYGYVNAVGNEVLKPIYEMVTNIDNGIGFVSNEGKMYKFTY